MWGIAVPPETGTAFRVSICQKGNLSICFTVVSQLFLRPSKNNNGNGNNRHDLKLHCRIFDSAGSSALGLLYIHTRSVWVWIKSKVLWNKQHCYLLLPNSWHMKPKNVGDLTPKLESLRRPVIVYNGVAVLLTLFGISGVICMKASAIFAWRLSLSVGPAQLPLCPSHTKHPKIIIYSISVLVFQFFYTYLVLGEWVF